MEVREQQKRTRWLGELSGEPADDAAAHAALDEVSQYLRSDGWTLDEEANTPEHETGTARILYFNKGHVNLRAFHERGHDTVGIFANTVCIDHPEDHKMLRSPLDPSYGNSSQYYLDGIDPTLDNY